MVFFDITECVSGKIFARPIDTYIVSFQADQKSAVKGLPWQAWWSHLKSGSIHFKSDNPQVNSVLERRTSMTDPLRFSYGAAMIYASESG